MFNRTSAGRRTANSASNTYASGNNFSRQRRQEGPTLIDNISEICDIRTALYYICIFIVSLNVFFTLRLFLFNPDIDINNNNNNNNNNNKNPYDKNKLGSSGNNNNNGNDQSQFDIEDPIAALNSQIENDDDNDGNGDDFKNIQKLSKGRKKKIENINNNQFSFANVHFNPSLTEESNNLNYINVSDPLSNVQGCKKYTYMQLTDGTFDYLYGILAIHGALIRTKSKYAHNIMLMPNGVVSQDQIDLFHYLGIGTYYIDPSSMDPKLIDCVPCWNVTFYKMFIWNMTQFDKILYLDTDVGIMSSNSINVEKSETNGDNNDNNNNEIERMNDGFDGLLENYPTPAAVSDRANQIELNGGILLVKPDNYLFNKLLKYLPNVRNPVTLRDKKKILNVDPWNCEWREYVGDQGYINSFFRDFGDSNEKTDSMGMAGIYNAGRDEEHINGIKYDTGFEFGPFYNIHYRYGILTSRFSNPHQWYFLQHRPYMIKGVHFTVYKPWHIDGKNRLRQILSNMERANQKDPKNDRVVYTDEMMTRFWVRYWLDVRIALNKCGDYCKKHWPTFEIPNDVDKWLKLRPVPFEDDEDVVQFHVK